MTDYTCTIDGTVYDRCYEDGGEWPTTPLLVEAERAFRESFLAAAREAAAWDYARKPRSQFTASFLTPVYAPVPIPQSVPFGFRRPNGTRNR